MGSNETYIVNVKGDVAEWKLLDQESLPGGRVAGSLNLLPNNHFLLTGGWDPATAETFDDGCTFEL
jgi:hypothetical protein